MKKRFLLSLSYIGTHFKSCAKTSKDVDFTTVVGAVENTLQLLASTSHFYEASPVIISSRTDAGVHALLNTAHVDIKCGNKFCDKTLMSSFNHFCSKKKKIPLRICDIRQVSDEFNARKFAKKRVYLYRIGIPRSTNIQNDALIPILEQNHCYFLSGACFDLKAFQEVLSLFPGTRDFTSFTGRPTHQKERSSIRHLHSFYACPGKSLADSVNDPICSQYDFWDIFAEGSSFVYRQVRQMVSASLAVAQGKSTIGAVQHMLDSPAPSTGLGYELAPAHGLYLIKVVYDDADLAIDRKRGISSEHLKLLHVLDQQKLSLFKCSM